MIYQLTWLFSLFKDNLKEGINDFLAIQKNLQSENQNVLFKFSDFKKNFLTFLVFEIPE